MVFKTLEFELPLFSFLFILLLLFVYFSKRKINLIENKMYDVILVSSLVASFSDTIVHIVSAMNTMDALNNEWYFFINNMIVVTDNKLDDF